MVGFAVIVGIVVAKAGIQFSNLVIFNSILGFFTGFCISSFSMITNDVYDYDVDKVNKPNRPVASGKIGLADAKIYSLPFLIVGLFCSLLISYTDLAIAAIFAFIGWYYNNRGKKYGLAGNALVAVSLAIPYIFGSFAVSSFGLNLAYLLALTSFLAAMGREVLKGISDVPGDKLRKIRSVAITYGIFKAKNIAGVFFLLAVASSVLPVLAGVLGPGFLYYIVLVSLTDLLFCYLAFRTFKLKKEKESLKLKSIALGGMLLGLVAYLVAGLAA